MAGILPGIALSLAFIVVSIILYRKVEKASKEKIGFKEGGVIFKDALAALLMPVIILGGIYSGLFTATEAAAVSVIYALIVGCFVYKTLELKTVT
jgi:C4-dicarboxylate transporter DctM subunit